MKYKHKNVLIYGMSSSGEAVAELLGKLNANVYIYDDDVEKCKSKRIKNCYIVQELNDNLIEQFDMAVISPSIEPNNNYLITMRDKGLRIFSELEFAAQFAKRLVAVTGTNGKTTVVELITTILSKKYDAVSCGNIGYPISRAVLEKKNSIMVAEVSSFMLENADTFSPHVATVTNIEPDHLVRHKTFEEYKRLKMSIFKNLRPDDYAVINLDSKNHTSKNCYTITYSTRRLADVYLKDGCIYLHHNKIIACNELNLKGKHNIENVMCAICYGYIYRVQPKLIGEALKSYKAERFRIEDLGKINGIHFVNDSKSTNIASTIASTDTIKGAIILLLGGSKKGLNYNELFCNLTKRVVKIIAFGELADEFELSNDSRFDLYKTDDLTKAFEKAIESAKPNDTILLSPASASYDQFASYVERGEMFNSLVQAYAESTKE